MDAQCLSALIALSKVSEDADSFCLIRSNFCTVYINKKNEIPCFVALIFFCLYSCKPSFRPNLTEMCVKPFIHTIYCKKNT